MNKFEYDSLEHHMKGFIQGLLFILIIIIIILFFQFIGYLDKSFSGNDYYVNEDDAVEYWNEDIDKSDGIRDGNEKKSVNPIYEQRKKDFGSKSLNEKDRDKADKDKQEMKKKSSNYLKK